MCVIKRILLFSQRRFEGLILAGLLLFAFVLRIYASVYYTISTCTDIATHAMMARHIAEARHFPLIFYNSPYVGTLELYFGALFDRWLPHSLFPSLLGFSLLSFLGLPVFYFFSRRLLGSRVAMMALALLIIGPPEFFYRLPFIGYPSVFLFGMLSCWLCVDLVDQVQKEHPVWGRSLLLGLVAGLGWWTSSLVIVYLVPCALVLAVGVPLRYWLRIIGNGLAGVLLGAAPWLLYALSQSEAVQFVTNVAYSRSLIERVQLAFRMTRILMQFRVSSEHLLLTATTIAWIVLFLGSLAYTLKYLWTRKGRVDPSAVIYGLPWLIIVSNIFICSMSGRFVHVPASRYMLPLYPALALIAAHGLQAWQWFRIPWSRGITAGCLGIILLGQFVQLPNYWNYAYRERRAALDQSIEQLTAFSENHGVKAFYGDFFHQWMSFAADERFTITSFPNHFDRYRPYREAVVLNPAMGVLNRYFGVDQFVKATQGTATLSHVGGYSIHWQLRPPTLQTRVLDSGEISFMQWDNGESAWALLSQNLDKPISYGLIRNRRLPLTERTVHVRLHSPRVLAGLRAWGPSGSWGYVTRMEIATTNGVRQVTHADMGFKGWFWSEGYPFLHGPLAQFEVHVDPQPVSDVWVTVQAVEEYGWPLVTEIQLLEAATASPAILEPVADQDAFLRQLTEALVEEAHVRHPPMIYTSRGLAEFLRKQKTGLPSVVPEDLYQQYEGVDQYSQKPIVRMDTVARAFMVLDADQFLRTGQLFQAQGWSLEILREVAHKKLVQIHAHRDTLPTKLFYWTEAGAFAAEADFAPPTEPNRESHLLFSGNLRFGRCAGRRLESMRVARTNWQPGEEMEVQLLWKCAPQLNPTEWAVFIHFIEDGVTRFQGDHVWLYDVSLDAIAKQPDGWVITSTTFVRIPEDIPEGTYSVRIGLYHRGTGKRLRTRRWGPQETEFDLQKRAALLPDVLTIRRP